MLLRGINVGRNRRIGMPALRELLTEAGFTDVRTYVQSGNVVLSSSAPPGELAQRSQALIAQRFGFDVDVLVRTRDELAEVVARNPLADVAVNPKRYQVTFLERELDAAAIERLNELSTDEERMVCLGREVYAWHPEGASSKLWAGLADPRLGVSATARNWTTVTQLLATAG